MEHIRQNLRQHKKNQNPIFDLYEGPNEKNTSSLKAKCLFCKIVSKQIEKLEYEDDKIAIFYDKD